MREDAQRRGNAASHSDLLLVAPSADALPRFPQSWYFVCASGALARGAVREVVICERRIAVFRTSQGRLGAVDARCPHFGARLASGKVRGETLECPLHRFRFARDGGCAAHGLRAQAYAIEEGYGAIFLFPATQALFPLPSFDGNPELVSARPRRLHLTAPWYMVTVNAFDFRHLKFAHDRVSAAPPQVSAPHPSALRVVYEYEICGKGWVDRAVRHFSGSQVHFSVTAWGGNLLQVHARFDRDESFGLLQITPAAGTSRRLDVTLIANARRRGSYWLDHLRAEAKGFAISRMLHGDIVGLDGLEYVPDGLRPGDEAVAQFLRWAAKLPHADHQGERKTCDSKAY